MSVATMTSKGQITVPRDVREQLHLAAGGKVDFRVDRDKCSATMVPLNRSVAEVFGLLHHLAPKAPVSVAQMKKAIARHVRSSNR